MKTEIVHWSVGDPPLKTPLLTAVIGNFDGVHMGHQKLFKRAREFKKRYKCKIGVVTFNPMPKMFFNKKLKHFKLMNLSQKIEQFKKLEDTKTNPIMKDFFEKAKKFWKS